MMTRRSEAYQRIQRPGPRPPHRPKATLTRRPRGTQAHGDAGGGTAPAAPTGRRWSRRDDLLWPHARLVLALAVMLGSWSAVGRSGARPARTPPNRRRARGLHPDPLNRTHSPGSRSDQAGGDQHQHISRAGPSGARPSRSSSRGVLQAVLGELPERSPQSRLRLVVDPSGHPLTNAHVIEGGDLDRVSAPRGGRKAQAKVVGADRDRSRGVSSTRPGSFPPPGSRLRSVRWHWVLAWFSPSGCSDG